VYSFATERMQLRQHLTIITRTMDKSVVQFTRTNAAYE